MFIKTKYLRYLSQYINAQYLDRQYLDTLKRRLHQDCFVKHIVCENFLKSFWYQQVISDFKNSNLEYESYDNTIIKKGGGGLLIGSYVSQLESFLYSNAFSAYLSYIFDISIKPYRKYRLGYMLQRLFQKGSSVQIYKKGDYLNWHTDGPTNIVKGAFVLYMNEKWNETQGGLLQLGRRGHKDNIIAYKNIVPIGNTFVILKTEEDKSWHRVTKLSTENLRYSIHDQLI